MRYLSVCSGIEAATVAWHGQGFEPLAFSEIEKFPRQVLAHHYPDVPLHGDFTVLREQDWIGDADILVGGTPCQAFSVAGLRNSLDDDRGNLTLEFVRLADAIDDLRPTGCGTIIVWENVPGVLSVKDNAFGCFLGALVGNDDPIVPTGGKWTSAGMVVGSKRSAAWRVLDAQYFGVAQRRRRVFVVASARDDIDPAEILFEREGMRRNTPPSREQGKEVAATVAARFGISRNNHEEVVTQFVGEVAPTLTKEGTGVVRPGFQEDGWYVGVKNGSHWDGDQYPHPTLSQSLKSSGGVGSSNQEVFSQRGAYLAPVAARMVAFGEYVDDGTASTMKSRDYKDATDLVAQPVAFGVGENPDLGHCLRSGASKADKHESTTYVAQPTMIHGTQDPIISDIAFPPGRNSGQENVLVQPMAVRRLTPVECERLQGFPDNYTDIPKAADGPRYKALGNSMAVPVMTWIGKRIAREVAA
jgi:DNA (cytosine-5)-methyltransferase 1